MLGSYATRSKKIYRSTASIRPNSGSIFESGLKRNNANGLPSEIQASAAAVLGDELPQVAIHKNSSKADAINALAFTQGNHIHFAPGAYNPHSTQGKELIGHELAHVAQQSQGQVSPTNYENGQAVNNSEALEKEADQVGKQVATSNVKGSLGPIQTPAHASEAGGVIQKYEKTIGYHESTYIGFIKTSDDGKMMVEDHGMNGYATDDLITRANDILKGLHSPVEVKKSNHQKSVPVPGQPNQKNDLEHFTIVGKVWQGHAWLPDDCGQANHEIMGSSYLNSSDFKALYGPANDPRETSSARYYADDRKPGGNLSTTETMSTDIYMDIFKSEFNKDLDRKQALNAWTHLDSDVQGSLNEKYGINEYAVPKMGQSVTIGSEQDMVGEPRKKPYNFHFGYNLMQSGHDYITLEDYDRSGVPYYLNMYGPASKKQAWAQEPINTGAMTENTTSMVVVNPNN